MKRLLAFCLALLLAVGCVPALAQEAKPTKLVIGSNTEMSGCFFTDLWGNNASDMDVRGLIHGYSTVAWMKGGSYALDESVVTGMVTRLNNRGQKVYEFTLNDQLLWSDGSRVTAKDYVFSVLLLNSRQLTALGASGSEMGYLAGQQAFASGDEKVFSGVRLLGDYSFSLSVEESYLPYFYELMLVNVTPYPMAAIAPGIDIADDGDGAYFVGDLTEELLRATILDETTGYLSHPAPTCGPYRLVSYDAQQKIAQFAKNPYYQGNFEGQIPEMEELEFRSIRNEDMQAALESGEVDILNKVADGDVITQMLAAGQSGSFSSINYVRAGFGFLAFACEDEATGDVAVRKAIAKCIDADALCADVFQGYALPVYGYYGLGQWMTSVDSERLSELNLYGYDPDGAVRLLVDSGWTLNEQGRDFAIGTDDVRCRNVDGVLVPLTIRWAKADNAANSAALETMLTAASERLGFKLEITEVSFAELLSHYYRQTDRAYNLFNLSTNFDHVFDPYNTYNTGDSYQGVYNTSGLSDEKLMELADSMRKTAAEDTDGYYERWFAFQQRWAELLPMAPLYSNVYFDFYRGDLYGYDINSDWGWSASILYATFTEPEASPDGMVIEP